MLGFNIPVVKMSPEEQRIKPATVGLQGKHVYWGQGHSYMSQVMRKPDFGVCDQVWLKPACSATETS